ncbi:putative inorganic carbon transporter subunit DabA, partial [uncultured Marinobacter sp.]|uniref:putative inorganic carbon transporter subunit DabA n=1 Tax=uncultured Marinobacter sp. TaxID=187379 RepID=UPI0030D88085
MTSASAAPKSTHLAVNDWEPNLRSVCDWLAPTWALDQWIAVNPFWGLKHLPASRADALLRQHGGFSIVMPAEFYLEAWEGGRIREEDLLASLNESASTESPEQLLGWLKNSHANVERSFGSVIDSFPPVEEDQAAIEAVCAQIAGTCAAFFDQHQAGWSGSVANQNLYRFWLDSTRDNVLLDANTGVSGARSCLQTLPANLDEAIERAVSMLGLCPEELQAIAHSWLLRVNGWAAWCRGEDWRAQLEARSSDRVWELLGIALAWETIGLQCAPASRKATYLKQRAAMARSQTAALADKRWVWHRAFEIRYQQTLWQSLATAPHHDAHHESPPAVQAVFCIDVRSEVMRRHLETSYPQVRTLGFAGFFGLAVEHQEHGPKLPVRRLPGLLPAPYRFVSNSGSLRSDHQINRRLDQREITRSSVRKAKYSSLSTFTLVETTGLAWGWKLIRDSLKKTASDGSVPECDGRLVHKTTGDPLTDAEKADLVAGMLRGMSLTSDFAPLVVFVGHGSHTNNNPNQAGLDCGACGGQSGAVNASLAARLFNEPSVRALLAKRDIPVPDSTWAVAAEHCTLTDTVNWLDTERVPDSHLSGLAKLQAGFVQAGVAVRRERASALGLNG